MFKSYCKITGISIFRICAESGTKNTITNFYKPFYKDFFSIRVLSISYAFERLIYIFFEITIKMNVSSIFFFHSQEGVQKNYSYISTEQQPSTLPNFPKFEYPHNRFLNTYYYDIFLVILGSAVEQSLIPVTS